MDPLEQQILDLLTSNGGQMERGALTDAIEYKDRQRLQRALNSLSRQGLISKSPVWDAETNSLSHPIKKL